MEEIAAERPKLGGVLVFAIGCSEVSWYTPGNYRKDILLGMARNPIRVTAFRWARRTPLKTSPLDIYNG